MLSLAGDSYVPISQDDTAQEGWLCMSFTKGIVLRKVFIVLTKVLYSFFNFLSGLVLRDVCEGSTS